MEDFKQRYNRIKNSPDFKRTTYARRVMAGYVAFFIFLFLIPAYLTDKYWGISSDVTCAIAGLAAVVLGILIGNKKVKEKFGR